MPGPLSRILISRPESVISVVTVNTALGVTCSAFSAIATSAESRASWLPSIRTSRVKPVSHQAPLCCASKGASDTFKACRSSNKEQSASWVSPPFTNCRLSLTRDSKCFNRPLTLLVTSKRASSASVGRSIAPMYNKADDKGVRI